MQRHRISRLLIATAVGGWIAMSAAAAFAQQTPQTADMSVTGTIVPAACSANFEGGGVVDFGTIRLIDLPANAYYAVGSRDVALNVNCTANKTVTFTVQDLQIASKIADTAMYAATGTSGRAAPQYVYGLGEASVSGASVKLGSYSIAYRTSPPTTVDGISKTVLTRVGTAAWTPLVSHYTSSGEIFSAGTSAAAGATAGRAFYFPMRITAALNYGSRLQVAQDTPFNGQAVFAINYQ